MKISSEKLNRRLKCGVLLAVSGGADSVAMLRICVERRSADSILAVAHVNHDLRGDESEEDARFVRALADRFALPYFEHRIEKRDWSLDETGSRESAARNIRYDFLTKTALENGLRHIATAHTKNDQVETVLHRILRGTGIAGLAGIPAVRPLNDAVSLIRPLLDVSREEIVDYLADLGQPYRIDSTNATPDFTRNRLRLELLPKLRAEYNANLDDALGRLAELAGDVQAILDEKTATLRRECVIFVSETEIRLNRSRLVRESPFAVRELLVSLWKELDRPLRRMGFEEWNVLENEIRVPRTPRLQLPEGVEITVDLKTEIVHIRFG